MLPADTDITIFNENPHKYGDLVWEKPERRPRTMAELDAEIEALVNPHALREVRIDDGDE